MSSQVSAYHRLLFRWHNRTFFPFRKNLSSQEKGYIEACFGLLEDFRETSETGFTRFSSFSYSHRVLGDQVNSSRLAYGSVTKPQAAREAAQPVLRERGIRLASFYEEHPAVRFGGLGWDIEQDQFKLYFRVLDLGQLPPDLGEVLGRVKPPPHHPEGLVSFTYTGSRLSEKKVYLYPEEGRELPPDVVGEAWMVTDQRGLVHQYDLCYPSQWASQINRHGQALVAKYLERRQTLDTIVYQDADHFTLYFP